VGDGTELPLLRPMLQIGRPALRCGREEEVSFSRTLVKGLELFKKAAAAAKGGQLAGRDAFLLWDTFGFPLDLTQACRHLTGPELLASYPS